MLSMENNSETIPDLSNTKKETLEGSKGNSAAVNHHTKQTEKILGKINKPKPQTGSQGKPSSPMKMKQVLLTNFPGKSKDILENNSIEKQLHQNTENNEALILKQVNVDENEGKIEVVKSPIEKKEKIKSERPNKGETEKEGNEKSSEPSLCKRAVESIIGGCLDKEGNKVFAVKFKKNNEVRYYPYEVIKKKIPSLVCEYFEDHIVFI